MIITVLRQSDNIPTYARIRISDKSSGQELGLMNVNAGTYWATPQYPGSEYIVEVLEVDYNKPVDTPVRCEVRAQDALVGVYFDRDNQPRICAASKQEY